MPASAMASVEAFERGRVWDDADWRIPFPLAQRAHGRCPLPVPPPMPAVPNPVGACKGVADFAHHFFCGRRPLSGCDPGTPLGDLTPIWMTPFGFRRRERLGVQYWRPRIQRLAPARVMFLTALPRANGAESVDPGCTP